MQIVNKMRKILFMLLLCPLFLKAQESENVDVPSRFIFLKFSHLSLIDPIPSIQLAMEYQLKGNKAISLQHEAGYITNIYLHNPNKRNLQGIRLRNEVRFYLQPRGKTGSGFYFAPEILFIQYSYTETGTICHGSEDEFFRCNYREKVDYKVQKQVYALHPKIGFQSIYKRLTVDLYAGVGYRQVKVEERDKPQDQFDEEDFFNFRKSQGIYHLPGLSLGFKIGCLISK